MRLSDARHFVPLPLFPIIICLRPLPALRKPPSSASLPHPPTEVYNLRACPLTWFYLQSDETRASAHASQAGERSGGGQGRSLYAEGVQMLLQAAKEVCAVDDQHEAFGKSCLISEYMLETSAPV